MANFNFSTVANWFTHSTSIIGTATAAPALLGAATGIISWTQAVLPLIGGLISILMPQKAAAVSTAVPAVTADVQGALNVLPALVSDVSTAAKHAANTATILRNLVTGTTVVSSTTPPVAANGGLTDSSGAPLASAPPAAKT